MTQELQETCNRIADKIVESLFMDVQLTEGGAGSGNWGHRGIPGKRGGSLPRGSGGGSGEKEKKARKSLHYKRKILKNRQERIRKLESKRIAYQKMQKEIKTLQKQVGQLTKDAKAGGKDSKLAALKRTASGFKKDLKTKELSAKNRGILSKAISDINGQIAKASEKFRASGSKIGRAGAEAARTAETQPK